MSKTTNICKFVLILLAAAGCSFAQVEERWELGVAGGYGFYKNTTATNKTGDASVGFKPGYAFSAVASNEINRALGGEARYTYRQNDLKVSSGGTEASFSGESHVLNYDFLFHFAPRAAKIRPFLAAGAGVKIYRGTGQEMAFQPLSSFVVLTRTTEVTPLVSVGGGVKIQVSRNVLLRLEARDFASTFPKEVIAPVPGASVSGWLHDITPMIGLSFNLGR